MMPYLDIILGLIYIIWAFPRICNPSDYLLPSIQWVMVLGCFVWAFVIVTNAMEIFKCL